MHLTVDLRGAAPELEAKPTGTNAIAVSITTARGDLVLVLTPEVARRLGDLMVQACVNGHVRWDWEADRWTAAGKEGEP